jgi:hypothetical protein
VKGIAPFVCFKGTLQIWVEELASLRGIVALTGTSNGKGISPSAAG